jgi:hypothetical protein
MKKIGEVSWVEARQTTLFCNRKIKKGNALLYVDIFIKFKVMTKHKNFENNFSVFSVCSVGPHFHGRGENA